MFSPVFTHFHPFSPVFTRFQQFSTVSMFGAVCFHSSLTKEHSRQLELQKKRSLACILGSHYQNDHHALSITALTRLDTLREEACLKWAIKAEANPQHSHLFPANISLVDTRFRKQCKEYKCKGSKFYNSAVPSMLRALKKHNMRFNSLIGRSGGEVTVTTNSGIVLTV